MKKAGTWWRIVCCIVIPGLILAGCATRQVETSGFLGDYSQFTPDPENEDVLIYEKPGVDWKQYKRFMLDPIEVRFHPDAEDTDISQEDLDELRTYFREAVEEELGDAYPVVDEPAPDVLRVRTAITEVVSAEPLLNAVAMAAVFMPADMGGAAIEAEFMDSESNERLFAVVEKKMGTPMDLNIFNGLSSYGYTRSAFRTWAEELREEMDKVHEEQ